VDVAACPIKEVSGHASLVLTECTKTTTGPNGMASKPLFNGLVNDGLKTPAVDRKLRNIEACVDAPGFTPDFLTKPVGVDQLVGSDCHLIQPPQQAKLLELLYRMREGVDPDPQFSDAIGLFVELCRYTSRVEHESRRKAADSAADDDRFHRYSS
jgi:hypothetical protein